MSWMRRIFAGSFVLLALLLLCRVGLYVSTWNQRLKAERIMAVVRGFRPGVTTQDDYERAIHPFLSSGTEVFTWGKDDHEEVMPYAIGIGDQPEWIVKAFDWMPVSARDLRVGQVFLGRTFTDGIGFMVVPEFRNHKLNTLIIQEFHGSGHPGGGFVEIRAGQDGEKFMGTPDPTFNGYWIQQMHWNGLLWSSIVHLDDRATPEERHRALDFKFECFTSFTECADGRRILDPVAIAPQQ